MLAGGRLPSGRGRHHSSAMRSGPSTRTMRWACWRQWKTERRIVGHEGHDIDRLGPLQQPRRPRALHRGQRASRRRPARAWPTAPVVCTRSGRWLSRGSRRTTFSAPSRSASRSARSIVPSSPSDSRDRAGSGSASCVPSRPRPRARPGSSARRRSRDRARPASPRTASSAWGCRGWAGWCRSRCGRPSRRRDRARSRAGARRRPPARTAGRGRRAGGWSRRRCPRAGRSARRRRAACGKQAAGGAARWARRSCPAPGRGG